MSYSENSSLGEINSLHACITEGEVLFYPVKYIMHFGFVLKSIYANKYLKADSENSICDCS